MVSRPCLNLAPKYTKILVPPDNTVLNFALTLEHLENAFYAEGLGKFSQADFDNAGLPHFARGRFTQVADHEKAHVALLQKVLGDQATQPCTYKLCVLCIP